MLRGPSLGDALRGSGSSGSRLLGLCKSEITTLIQRLYLVSGLLGGPNNTFSVIVVTELSEIVRLQNLAMVRAVGLGVVNTGRTVSGFIVSYFESTWAEAEGMQKGLGIQAAVAGARLPVFTVPL